MAREMPDAGLEPGLLGEGLDAVQGRDGDVLGAAVAQVVETLGPGPSRPHWPETTGPRRPRSHLAGWAEARFRRAASGRAGRQEALARKTV
ncbi:MAG: hypothetical protein GDA40_07210 [Rhodobacteraceae bacterium]|nr:hypothetical protein [Paracoccaceae bacterium]